MLPRAERGAMGSAVLSGALFSCALACAVLGLGRLHDADADVARALFFVCLLLAMVPILRRAARETP
jgi:uncharacterized membrane protein YtjA (UPF0391 family)